MKYYLAGSGENIKFISLLARELLSYDYYPTHLWWMSPVGSAEEVEFLPTISQIQRTAIELASEVIVVLPGRKGTYCELGYAMALNKKIILCIPNILDGYEPPFVFDNSLNRIYFYPPDSILQVEDSAKLLTEQLYQFPAE